ncbi:Glycoside hydrolase family 43 [Penicillium frequentans]|uniref:Arabinan endo-1,5-alpha-L-arabinosidase n=1 Tax=Penicillium frequentans TaxID=3151616 RepID=A0AAD6D712_9EURO|nr:Glycoside hydrolase family 43 [Penicillium glabrum]
MLKLLFLEFFRIPHSNGLAQVQHQPGLNSVLQRDITFPPPRQTNQHTHDPSILLDNDYYLYQVGPNINISISASMDGPWVYLGSVLNTQTIIPKPQDNLAKPWAPDTIKQIGTYYCYYSCYRRGNIQFTAAWRLVDHGVVLQTGTGEGANISPYNMTNAIDPNPFIDSDDTVYLNHGSYWEGIYQVSLKSDMLAPENTTNSDARHLVGPASEDDNKIEGAFLASHDDFYYLWFSHGACCDYDPKNLPAAGEDIRVGRSGNPRGPFLDRYGMDLASGGGELVYGSNGETYAPGGQGVLFDGIDDVLYYHYRMSTALPLLKSSVNTSVGLDFHVSQPLHR